jgi:surface antigen
MEKGIARKGGKKNRKHGRNKRISKNLRQRSRTEKNKARRKAYEEAKAGRKLTWATVKA